MLKRISRIAKAIFVGTIITISLVAKAQSTDKEIQRHRPEAWEKLAFATLNEVGSGSIRTRPAAANELKRLMGLIESEDISTRRVELAYGVRFSNPAAAKFGEIGSYSVSAATTFNNNCKPASMALAAFSTRTGDVRLGSRIAGKPRQPESVGVAAQATGRERSSDAQEILAYPLGEPGFDGDLHHIAWASPESSASELHVPVSLLTSKSSPDGYRWAAASEMKGVDKGIWPSAESEAKLTLFMLSIKGRNGWTLRPSALGILESEIAGISESSPDTYLRLQRVVGRPSWLSKDQINRLDKIALLEAIAKETELEYRGRKGTWRLKLSSPISEVDTRLFTSAFESARNNRLSPPCGKLVATLFDKRSSGTPKSLVSQSNETSQEEAHEFLPLVVNLAESLARGIDSSLIERLGGYTRLSAWPQTHSGKVWKSIYHPALLTENEAEMRTSSFVGDLKCSFSSRTRSMSKSIPKFLSCKPDFIRAGIFLSPKKDFPTQCLETSALLRQLAGLFQVELSPRIGEVMAQEKALEISAALSGAKALNSTSLPLGPTPASVSRALGHEYFDNERNITPHIDMQLSDKFSAARIAVEIYSSGAFGSCIELVALGFTK